MRNMLYILAVSICICLGGCVTNRPSTAANNTAENNIYYVNDLRIVRNILEDNEYNRKYKLPGTMKVEYITIHNTANKAPAIAERNYLNNRRDNVPLSFHFAVDENEAIQIMPLDVHGWHAGDGKGDGNMKSIGIEICRSTLYEGDLYQRSEDNAVKLAAYLLFIHNLDVSALRRHEEWSGKKCPHRMIEANTWDDFKHKVGLSLEQLKRKK